MREEGLYRVRAVSWGWAVTTNDHDQFWMRFEVVGKADPDADPQACEPGTGVWSITLSDGTADWLISTVQHLGYDGDDLLSLDPDQPGAFNFEGTEFLAECKHEEHNGRTREKWTVYKKAKPAKERLQALNARFGHKVKELKKRRTGGKDKTP